MNFDSSLLDMEMGSTRSAAEGGDVSAIGTLSVQLRASRTVKRLNRIVVAVNGLN